MSLILVANILSRVLVMHQKTFMISHFKLTISPIVTLQLLTLLKVRQTWLLDQKNSSLLLKNNYQTHHHLLLCRVIDPSTHRLIKRRIRYKGKDRGKNFKHLVGRSLKDKSNQNIMLEIIEENSKDLSSNNKSNLFLTSQDPYNLVLIQLKQTVLS